MNRRRMLIALAALPASRSLAQPRRLWRVGILSVRPQPSSLESDFQYGPFLQGMRELGYIDGRNVALEWRFANGRYEALQELAADLVRLKVDVMVVINVPVIRAAQLATRTIPTVMLSSSDPVDAGFVDSLSRPGGNITGLSNLNVDLSSKHLEFLKLMVPNLPRVAFLQNPANSAHRAILKNIQAAALRDAIRVFPVEAASAFQLDGAFDRATSEHCAAMIVGIDSAFLELRHKIVELTFRHRMAAMFSHRIFVAAGGLMSYGQDFDASYRRGATYVDKILKGARAEDLPVERATALRLVINRKTAMARGLIIPPELALRADEVID